MDWEKAMRKFWFVLGICGVFLVGSAWGVERLSDFKAKALDVIEKTRAAVESPAFKELEAALKEKRLAARFLVEGAYTSKFLNAKDKKEYFLTAVPMVSYFQKAAPPLAALIVSDGEAFRAGLLKVSQDRRRELVCRLETGAGKAVARAGSIQPLKEPPLPVPRGEAAIAITRNPEGDDVILILCRSPYEAKEEKEMECLAVTFYSGDLAWDRLAGPDEEKPE
jgi:hypothetical protein